MEIGPGYGIIYAMLNHRYPDIQYYGIDVNPLFDCPTLYHTDGSYITDKIPNDLDIVYSYNVFQHISKKQRTKYYQQIYSKLKEGGEFHFGNFVMTKENKDWRVWGVKDEDENYYISFFKQYTLVDQYDELIKELEDIGFKVEDCTCFPDKCHYLNFKCVK